MCINKSTVIICGVMLALLHVSVVVPYYWQGVITASVIMTSALGVFFWTIHEAGYRLNF